MIFITKTDTFIQQWYILFFCIISILGIILSSFLINLIVKKRRSYKFNFEASGTQKLKYNLWNLVISIFICFSGCVGFIITFAILINPLF